MEVVKSYQDLTRGYEQRWAYMPLAFGSVSANRILELVKNKVITKKEVAIMDVLKRFRCAPVSLLKQAIPIIKDEDPVQLKNRLIPLVKQRILNAFIYTDDPAAKVDMFDCGAEVFFTCDYGAITVLKSVINDETLDDWKIINCEMSPVKCRKQILNLTFYIRLRKDCGMDLKHYNTFCSYSAHKTRFEDRATFELNDKFYMVETLTSDDIMSNSDTYLLAKLMKYENLFDEDHNDWKYFFPSSSKPPVVICVCDTRKTAATFAGQA